VSTDLNYVARLDTTQIMSGIAEIRSQVGMAFASPTGFASAAMAMRGGGFTGMNDASSGIATQMQGMLGGFGQTPGMFGTHTNPAMALNPHYGMNQAQTTLEEEWRVHSGGLAIAQQMRPPGVSAASYALGVESNFIGRQLDANHAAAMAGQAAFYSGVGGMAAGEGAAWVAGAAGGYAGGKIATRLFGAGAAGAGKLLGGLGAAWMAFDWANEHIGGAIQEHYADIEKTQGVTRELGMLAGAGRGLSRSQQTELGIAARNAASDLKMDFNEMGDILALGRQSGMLPTVTGDNPGKAREEIRNFARAIDEGAQVLGTSLASATQVIKAAAQGGMSAQEGIIRAAGAGGADAWLAQQARMSAFGAAGASVGMSMGYTAAQGSAMFTGSLGAGAGLTSDEMKIAGGRFGAAQFVGTTQMAMAASPLGNLQLMAAMGGGLSGAGMLDLPGAAMEGLMAGGGDFVSNALRFNVHQNEYRRGIGAGGIRTMARQQIDMGAELISSMAPDLSMADARRAYAQSMGLNPDQAELLAGGGGGGGGRGSSIGGGMGADAQARAMLAMQESRLASAVTAPERETGARRSFGLGYTIEGAMIGSYGGPWGTAAGAAAGFVLGNLGAAKDAIGAVFGDGPGLFASSTEKADYYERKYAAEFDKRMGAARDRMGLATAEQGYVSRFMTADLSGARLTLGGVSPGVSDRTEAALVAAGVRAVRAGAGTTQINGRYYSTSDIQKTASQPLWDRTATKAQEDAAAVAAASFGYGSRADWKGDANDAATFGAVWDMVRTGEKQTVMLSGEESPTGVGYVQEKVTYDPATMGTPEEMGERLLRKARGFAVRIGEDDKSKANLATRDRILAKLDTVGGLADPEVRAFLEKKTGRRLESLDAGLRAGLAGGAAAKFTVDATMQREAYFLKEVYGSGDPGDDVVGRSLQARYHEALIKDPAYLEAKEASLRGKDRQAADLLHQARANVLASDRAYTTLDTKDIDPTRAVDRPETAAVRGMLNVMGVFGGVDKELASKILGQTSWKKEVKAEAEAGIKALKAKRKRSGPGTLSRAVGFGQQESAMSSIQRSLAHVERSLNALDKRVSKQASEPPGTTGPGGTP